MEQVRTKTAPSKIERIPFSLVETLFVSIIITILVSALMPTLTKAKARARYANWRGYARDMKNDDALMLHYDFAGDSLEGEAVNNKALGLTRSNYTRDNYNGAITGASTVDGRWQFKRGLGFDGSSDHKVETSVPVDMSTSDVTIVVWAKPLENGGTILQQLNGTGPARTLIRTSETGKMTTAFGGGNTVTANAGALNEWNHYVITHSVARNELKLYLNGKLEKTAAQSGESCSGDLRLGQDGSGGSKFKGVIDEVVIYGRELSADEIKEMFRVGRP